MPTPSSTAPRPQAKTGGAAELLGSFLIGVAATLLVLRSRHETAKDEGPVQPRAFGTADEEEPTQAQMPRVMETGRGRSATSPWSIPWAGWKDILYRTYQQINEDRLLAVAAGVVFLGLLAIFPAITALVSLYGLMADMTTANDHLRALLPVLPNGSYAIIQDQVARVVEKSDGKLGFGFILGLLLALWSANAGMKAIMDSLNVVYGETEKRSFIRLNLISLTFTLGAVLFVLLAIASVIVFPLALEWIGLSSLSEWIMSALRWPMIAVVMLAGLAVLYRYGPSRRQPQWQWLSVGSVFACVFWIIGSVGLSIYLSNFADYDATYGTLGAAIGLMTWMYLSAIVVLIGAELNAEIEHQTAVDSTVGGNKPIGQRGAVMADTLGKSLNEPQPPVT